MKSAHFHITPNKIDPETVSNVASGHLLYYIITPRILTGCTCVPPPWCERSTSAKAWAWVAWTKHGFRDPIEELLIGAVAAKPRSVDTVSII